VAGALYAMLAGLFISLQSIFNVRVSEKAGFWLTNTLLHGSGFILSLLIFWMVKDGNLHKLQSVNKLYLLGGCMGVVIVFSAMKSVTALNPAYAIAIMLIVQLLAALALETFGWFGVDKVALSANRLMGISVMILGVVIFKYR
jgi:transporter family-2 protein